MVCTTRRVPGLPVIGLALLGVVVLAVPACTDDTGTTASVETSPDAPATSAAAPVDPITGNPIDPCSLLTADEVGSALQVAVGQPQAGPQSNLPNPLGQRTCTWSTAESPPRCCRGLGRDDRERCRSAACRAATTPLRNLFEDTKPLAEGLEPITGSATRRSSARSRACRCRCSRATSTCRSPFRSAPLTATRPPCRHSRRSRSGRLP